MKKLPWWQNLQIIAWVAGGLTAAGALIVGTAKYINLPREVEAAQQKNTQQDESINKLTAIQETWQQIYQQQQQIPNQMRNLPLPVRPEAPRFHYWQDEEGEWWRCAMDADCSLNRNWEREE